MADDILKKIVAHKKKEVLKARRDVSEKKLREAAAGQREKRPFFTSLSGEGGSSINIIAEIKSGATGAAVAKKFGVSVPTVQNIKKAAGLVRKG
jgi:indole-3-glycerol phosphate synthase